MQHDRSRRNLHRAEGRSITQSAQASSFHTHLLLRFQVARRDGRSLLVAWPLWRRPRYFLPALVRPRSSRCLCTGFTIQLMRGSCGGSKQVQQEKQSACGL